MIMKHPFFPCVLLLALLSCAVNAFVFQSTSLSFTSHGRRRKATIADGDKEENPGLLTANEKFLATAVAGPPLETKPDYENIVGPLGQFADYIFMAAFRIQLAKQVGKDSTKPLTDYSAIIDLARELNYQEYPQLKALQTLKSLFPSWLPGSYAKLFSRPFPKFSARMNAWATSVAGCWLMGECEVNDTVIDDGTVAKDQGLLVKRCRFLEEAGCASVCVNSCKLPTQAFFMDEMGIPLTMEPNYETHECQFRFGKTPDMETEEAAFSTPCLARCPTAGSLRSQHFAAKTRVSSTKNRPDGICSLIEQKNP